MGDLGIALVAGGLTTLNPCVFPILPLVIGAAVQANRLAPVLMGLGMATSFALLGVSIGYLTDVLNIDQDAIRTGSAVLLVVFGLVLLVPKAKELFTRAISPVANRANTMGDSVDQSSIGGAFAMGMLLGLVWTPCSGPLLASTLALAADGGAAQAGITLGVFGFGAAVPLMLVGYLGRGSLTTLRGWVLRHGDQAQKVMGVLLVAVGVMVLAGIDKQLEAALNAVLPQSWFELTTRF